MKKSNNKNKKEEWEDCDDCAICRAMKNGEAKDMEGLMKAFAEAEKMVEWLVLEILTVMIIPFHLRIQGSD